MTTSTTVPIPPPPMASPRPPNLDPRTSETWPGSSLELGSNANADALHRVVNAPTGPSPRESSAGVERRGQLVARSDLQLVVHVAKVVFDRLRAQVQLGRG